ncbi:hypothetical protein AB0K87_34500, partial [Streptomyces sp. NPDC053705]|uniref:hypothetical protein n=1 Tax=Streptomyces sp. NPDC053705 TaxID=3156668 RepID=UPI0034201A8E
RPRSDDAALGAMAGRPFTTGPGAPAAGRGVVGEVRVARFAVLLFPGHRFPDSFPWFMVHGVAQALRA